MGFRSMMQRAIDQQRLATPAPTIATAPGLATPAVMTEIETAVGQGTDLVQTIRDILNPREAAARRAAQVAAESAMEPAPYPIAPAGVVGLSGTPLLIAGLAAAAIVVSLVTKPRRR